MSEVDWKLVLAKYIDTVGECEGVYFDPVVGSGSFRSPSPIGEFTQEEVNAWWEALKLTNPGYYKENFG